TIIAVPLMREGTPIGVFAMARRSVRPFTDKQIELVETFADQAVIAIENARLFEAEQQRTRELSESLQQQTATADVLKVISRSTFDLKSVLQTLVESAGRLCGADYATITRQKDGGCSSRRLTVTRPSSTNMSRLCPSSEDAGRRLDGPCWKVG